MLRQQRATVDGHLFDRVEQTWRVDDGADESIVVPRLVGSTKSVFEGQPDPVSRIVTEQLAWTADGSVTEALERSYDHGSATPTHELRTETTYAADPIGRFRQRVSRVVQRYGIGALLAGLRTMYDGLPEGQVGAAGLVTKRIAFAITDA